MESTLLRIARAYLPARLKQRIRPYYFRLLQWRERFREQCYHVRYWPDRLRRRAGNGNGRVEVCEGSSLGTTPLQVAALEDDKRKVARLLAQGADINARDGDEKTPLFLAVARGNLELARYLVCQGADLNTPTGAGTTPLHAAIHNGDLGLFKLLVFQKGVDLDLRDELARTALHAAAAGGHVQMARILVNKGANLNSKDLQNKTPLASAIDQGDAQTAQALIDKGAELFDPDRDPMQQREELRKQMLDSPIAPIINQKLIALESAHNIEKVYSYPKRVSFLWTNVCNARCIFCLYRPRPRSERFYVTLEGVKKMTWLRYVTTLNCGAGVSDTLAHPGFLPIFRYISKTYPNLRTHLITNGIGLTKEICEAFCGNMFHLNISLNSPRKDRWEKTTRAKGFERILAMISYLAKLKEINNTSKPGIQLSMAVHEQNTDEVLEFLHLAKRIGADKVLLRNVRLHRRTKDALGSLYDRQEESSDLYEQVQQQAKALGLKLVQPELFSKETRISKSQRVCGTATACFDPWVNCIISGGTGKVLKFCCFGINCFVPCDLNNLTDDHFHNDVWNHPAAQFFRRTMNIRGRNPICDACYEHDRFDPATIPHIERLRKLVYPLLESVTLDTPVEEIEKRMQEVSRLL